MSHLCLAITADYIEGFRQGNPFCLLFWGTKARYGWNEHYPMQSKGYGTTNCTLIKTHIKLILCLKCLRLNSTYSEIAMNFLSISCIILKSACNVEHLSN